MESPFHEIAVFWDRLRVHYRHHVVQTGKEASFWVAITFLMTFGAVRGITLRIRRAALAAKHDPKPALEHHSIIGFHDIVLPGGLHIHHAVPGIFLALVSGYMGLVTERKAIRPFSIMYGIGSALALDEFALWLELRDVYWSKEGRRSFDAVALAGAGFLGSFALQEFGGAIVRDIRIRRKTGVYPPHHREPATKGLAKVGSRPVAGAFSALKRAAVAVSPTGNGRKSAVSR